MQDAANRDSMNGRWAVDTVAISAAMMEFLAGLGQIGRPQRRVSDRRDQLPSSEGLKASASGPALAIRTRSSLEFGRSGAALGALGAAVGAENWDRAAILVTAVLGGLLALTDLGVAGTGTPTLRRQTSPVWWRAFGPRRAMFPWGSISVSASRLCMLPPSTGSLPRSWCGRHHH